MFFLLSTFCQPVRKVTSASTTWLSAILGHKAPPFKENVLCSQVPLHSRNDFLQPKADCSADMWGYTAPRSLFLHPPVQCQGKAHAWDYRISTCRTLWPSVAQSTTQGRMVGPQIPLHQPAWAQTESRWCWLGSALRARRGARLDPQLQGSVVSASTLDQHSEHLSSSAWLWKTSLRKDCQLRKKISHIS